MEELQLIDVKLFFLYTMLMNIRYLVQQNVPENNTRLISDTIKDAEDFFSYPLFLG